ncbi:zinc finger and BTB domain-containing protein 18.3-like isoform X2 [Polyodon spathula]|nr:zinc finger and BTB domain-containing protein 18.3-like isoform X2 [Polyodon spathula]XP_041096558.1 zinc finger and BTB domain-containing protein 18.3-like isoform X2 [Polyodon spathula]XP_041096559.1 zinc finger and BTB domain-containing protein 18.3-like isoform X2 [Polyodon spathula]
MLSSPPSPSHCQHVMQQLCAQLEFGFLCDVIVSVGEVHFRAHRAVLAACSGFFHKLFITQPVLAERAHCSYALSSSAVSPQHFDAILQMMYQGPRGEGATDPELGAAMAFLEFYNTPPALLKEKENGTVQGLLYGVESRRPEGEGEMEEGEVVGQSLAVRAQDRDWKPGFLYSSSGVCMAEVVGEKEEKMQGKKGEEVKVDGKAAGGKNHSFSSFCTSPLSSSCTSSSSTSCSDSTSLPHSPSPSRAPAPMKSEAPESPSFLALHGIRVVQVSSEAGTRAASTSTTSHTDYLPELPLIIHSNPELSSSPKGVSAGVGGSRQQSVMGRRLWAWAGKSMLMKAEEGGSLSPPPKRALTPLSSPRPRMPSTFPCSRCELSFDTSQGLEEHLLVCGRERPARRWRVPRKHQRSPSPPFQTLPRSIKQEPCSMEVELEVDGVPLLPDLHPPEQSCKTCGKHFKRVKMLQTHRPRCPMLLQNMGRPRSEDRNHVCRTCGKAFLQRGHLTEHEATHSQVKRFSCSHCSKQFVRRRELKVHEARHEGQASYHCQFCGHASYRKNGHYHHLATHLLPPQAICQACFQICENHTQLLEHEMEHWHTCERCGAKYRLKKELILHYMDCQGLSEDWQ